MRGTTAWAIEGRGGMKGEGAIPARSRLGDGKLRGGGWGGGVKRRPSFFYSSILEALSGEPQSLNYSIDLKFTKSREDLITLQKNWAPQTGRPLPSSQNSESHGKRREKPGLGAPPPCLEPPRQQP